MAKGAQKVKIVYPPKLKLDEIVSDYAILDNRTKAELKAFAKKPLVDMETQLTNPEADNYHKKYEIYEAKYKVEAKEELAKKAAKKAAKKNVSDEKKKSSKKMPKKPKKPVKKPRSEAQKQKAKLTRENNLAFTKSHSTDKKLYNEIHTKMIGLGDSKQEKLLKAKIRREVRKILDKPDSVTCKEKRAPSAYNKFFKQFYAEEKAKDPSLTLGDISYKASQKWQNEKDEEEDDAQSGYGPAY